jgi:ribonuclease HI
MIYSVFCDGGARGNPGPAAIGFVVKDLQGQIIYQAQDYIGKSTNNIAEYTAVIHSLVWLQKFLSQTKPRPTQINFYLDSKLVVNQLNGYYKIKNAALRELIFKIRQLENQLKTPIKYNFINRQQNNIADNLVNLALDQALH